MIFENLPDGAYALPDPDQPWTMTYWTVTSGALAPWPVGAQYGPIRPPYSDRDSRTLQLENFRRLVAQHRQLVADAITEDPDGAQHRFSMLTGRCRRCRKLHSNADLKALADPSNHDGAAGPLANATAAMIDAAIAGSETDVLTLLGKADPAAVVGRLAGFIRALVEVPGRMP